MKTDSLKFPVFAVAGGNAAGKSKFLKALASVYQSQNGKNRVFYFNANRTAAMEISELKDVSNNSFVLIDDVELFLNPRSQRQIIRELLKLARAKALQIVITTRSSRVLEELPPDNKILLAGTNVIL